jgi:glycosyltransferase involved in cell wall biosynthesis
MNDIKKVSVVMCTYNGEKYLREQIESLLNQTYPIYETIIQYDFSTDDTWEI